MRIKADERVARYEWNSREGLVLGWSPIAGAVAVMAKMREPADTLEPQVELSFFLDGKWLRSWTAAELQKLGASIGHEREVQGSLRGAEFQLLDCVQLEDNEYAFRIAVGEEKKISFDVLMGEVYRPHKLSREEARSLAAEVARGRGVPLQDYVLTSSDFDSRTGAWQVFYHQKQPAFPGGHFLVEMKDETRETRFIGGR